MAAAARKAASAATDNLGGGGVGGGGGGALEELNEATRMAQQVWLPRTCVGVVSREG